MQPTRIQSLFESLKRENRAALIAYITAGDPTPERTPAIAAALERGGVDLIELGVPFSDPIADGPAIQLASDRALKSGTTVPKVLEMARQIRAASQIPLLLFTYMNPVLRYGLDKLATDAKAAGIDGCLLTDLSVEEADRYVFTMRSAGLETVFLAAPTSTDARLKLVAKFSTGFVYLVSRTGVTGERSTLPEDLVRDVKRLRRRCDLPLAVGFGISTPDQVAALGEVADAVVVGSALVRLVEQMGEDPDLPAVLEDHVRKLAAPLLGRGPHRAGAAGA